MGFRCDGYDVMIYDFMMASGMEMRLGIVFLDRGLGLRLFGVRDDGHDVMVYDFMMTFGVEMRLGVCFGYLRGFGRC